MLRADELARVVTALDAEGFDVHVHAIGDRAVRDTLDAFEAAAAANGRRDARHQIAHLQFVHPDDRPASAASGWSPTPSRSGRASTAPCASLTCRSWTRGGPAGGTRGRACAAPGGAGLRQRLVGVDRQPLGGDRGGRAPGRPDDRDGEPFLPAERVDLPTALDAFTSGSAYALRLEAETGSVTPGKLADLAVLDRDPFDRQPVPSATPGCWPPGRGGAGPRRPLLDLG